MKRMANHYTQSLREINRDSLLSVGGKGANLGELISNNFPVPDGFCVHVDAYQQFIRENKLLKKIEAKISEIVWNDPTCIDSKSAEIRTLLMEQPLSPEVENDIIKTYQQMDTVIAGKGYVAVRSSATAEDLPDSSFAGQQDTFLYIKGEKEVLHHIKRCWASLWNARAMAYRHKKLYEHTKVSISVVVQEMVDATVSGVLFTKHPLTHNHNELYITSSYGLGEPIVSGQVTPDIFILEKNSLTVSSRQLGTKEKQLLIHTKGEPVLSDVPQNLRIQYSLSDKLIKELGTLAKKVEDHYQSPQDIEWSYANDTLYLLQSRPITTLDTGEQITFPKLTNIQIKILDDLLEHYPEPPTPLDYSVVTMSYQGVLDRGEALGISFSRATDIIKMDQSGKLSLHPPKIKVKGKILFLLNKLIKASTINPSQWTAIERDFNSFQEKMKHLDISGMSNENLLNEFELLFSFAKKVTDLRFQLIIDSTVIPLLALSTVVKFSNKKRERPEISDIITTNLNYKTSVIDNSLIKLATQVSRAPEVKSLILRGSFKDYKDLKSALLSQPSGDSIHRQLQTFLEQYGYRTDKMYQPFNSKSWLDDSMYFLDVLKAVLNDPYLYDRKRKEQARNEKHELWLSEFEKNLKGPSKRLFRKNYEHLRKLYLYREHTVFFIEVIFHYGRKIINELGLRFQNQGILENSQDILYLLKEELSDVTLGALDPKRLSELVKTRKDNIETNKKTWRQSILQLSQKSEQNHNIIAGISGSNGLAKGRARIITKVDDFKKLEQGEILVCQYTDPAWTPLFGLAAAIVADTGGPLSHAAIVAREYDIPAVLGTKVGTTVIADGELIVVDGTSGKVTRINSEQSTPECPDQTTRSIKK